MKKRMTRIRVVLFLWIEFGIIFLVQIKGDVYEIFTYRRLAHRSHVEWI